MEKENYILLQDFCEVTKAKPEFLMQLFEHDLIQHITYNNTPAIHQKELPTIERMLRLHYDLNVNIEGLQIITHMREKMMLLQEEILLMKRKLKRFE